MAKRRKTSSFSFKFPYLGILRLALVFIPQIGYIHPDEYFQSVEVLAGKVFDVEHNPPWEFNNTLPIRGMTIPCFTTGLSYVFLRDINRLMIEYFSINVVSPYFLLIIPRLLITLSSFVIDYCLMKICVNNNEKYKSRLTILGTSYVILVYGTRTFSNTIELILFSLLIYFVCESQTVSNELIRKQEYIKYRYDKSTSLAEKAKFHKLKLYLVSDNYRNCLVIASLTVFGVFNRPTFIGFAVVPVFFWIYRGMGEKRVSVTQFHARSMFFAICCLPALVFNILVDSFYYGYITWGEIGMLEVSISNFVVTPLNFIRYNVDSSNLQKHGLHPRFLHLLVNIPLLFNVLGVVAFYTLLKYIYWSFRGKLQLLPSIRSIKMLMTMSFISPVLILSIFPHQEPRFLIPVLFPLVYLHSDKILPDPDSALIRVPDAAIQEKRRDLKTNKQPNELLKVWLILNVLLLVFYGFVHQGGVYNAVNYLHKDIQVTPANMEFHIVTSNIYSIPQSFFVQRSSSKLFTRNQKKYAVKKRIYLYEEGSKDLHLVIKQLKIMVEAKEMLKTSFKQNTYKIYLLISSSRKEEVERTGEEGEIIMHKLDSFWPHLSLEAMPDFTKYCFNPTFIFYKNCRVLPLWEYFKKLSEMCELILYELDFKVEPSIVTKAM